MNNLKKIDNIYNDDDESTEITDDEGHKVIVHRENLHGLWLGYSSSI
jgi:hypothetical protein